MDGSKRVLTDSLVVFFLNSLRIALKHNSNCLYNALFMRCQLTGLRTRPDLLFVSEWKSSLPKFDSVWKFQRKSEKPPVWLNDVERQKENKKRREPMWKGCMHGETLEQSQRARGARTGLICEKVKVDWGVSAPPLPHGLLSGDFGHYLLSCALSLNWGCCVWTVCGGGAVCTVCSY